jgi:hypothetical protein
MPTWLRIAIIAVLALVLWWLAALLGKSFSQEQPAPTGAGTGMAIPVAERLAT